ncbi:MAG: ATP-dependent DNA ligase, partial [Saprospiraceae bacterium]|nr:ATP-dependent DNA ligase [Saprospiraceae bacterium]
MRRFARLFQSLDQTTKTNDKVNALQQYFDEAPDQDKLWTIALLSHRRPRRSVTISLIREWAAEMADLPVWLFDESYHIVGDLAETIALVLPKPKMTSERTLSQWIEHIIALKDVNEPSKKEGILEAWQSLNHRERFVFNKLITGGFRIGVSQKLMTRSLSRATGIDQNILAHRLMGNWSPQSTTFDKLVLEERDADDLSRPYPFYLAYALDRTFEQLGSPLNWQAERKWDGIRGQLIKRKGHLFIWSRGEELVTDRFPEFDVLNAFMPDGIVIDGEILPFDDGKPLSFQKLQTRIGRKKITKRILQEAPVILMAYDLLE